MKVKLKKMDEKAVTPFKKYDTDFCYDMVAVSEEEIAPNVWKYRLGLAMQVERSMETIIKRVHPYSSYPEFALDFDRSPLNLSIDIRPRSSVWKTGMVLSNCIGTVDEDFTGEVSAVFYHVLPNMPRYKVGDRVCQMKIGFTLPIEFEYVDELSKTERADGGYGSTDK